MGILAYVFPERHYKEIVNVVKKRVADYEDEWPHITVVYVGDDITKEQVDLVQPLFKKYKSLLTPSEFDVFPGAKDNDKAYLVVKFKPNENFRKLQTEVAKVLDGAKPSGDIHISVLSVPKSRIGELKELVPVFNKEAKKVLYPDTPTALTFWRDHKVIHIVETKLRVKAELKELGLVGEKFKIKDIKRVLAARGKKV